MLNIEPNMISKINWNSSFYKFSHFSENPLIPKKSAKRAKSSNLGTKSLRVRALLHNLLPLCRLSGYASKTTYDVTTLFTKHGEQPGCFKSAWLHRRFFSLFIYLNSSAAEQPAVMIEQTSKNRSTVLKNISAGWETVQIKAVPVINR